MYPIERHMTALLALIPGAVRATGPGHGFPDFVAVPVPGTDQHVTVTDCSPWSPDEVGGIGAYVIETVDGPLAPADGEPQVSDAWFIPHRPDPADEVVMAAAAADARLYALTPARLTRAPHVGAESWGSDPDHPHDAEVDPSTGTYVDHLPDH